MVSTRLQYSVAIISIVLVAGVIVYAVTKPYVFPDLALTITDVTYVPGVSLQVNGEIGYNVPNGYRISIILVSIQDGDTIYQRSELGPVQGGRVGHNGIWGIAFSQMIPLESTTIQLTLQYVIRRIVLGTTELVEEGSKTFTVNI
jgi:hypothetical protein